MSEYETRVTAVMVNQVGESVFSEMATTVRIEDEAAGEFVVVEQVSVGKVHVCKDEWPMIRAAVDDMISKCREAT